MKNNIVIFGPAEAGKSTLGGYMHFKSRQDFDFKKFISDTKSELGNDFEDAQKFAYILDTAKDERERLKNPKLGTSKYMHTDRIRIGNKEVTIIDTPGAQHPGRVERIKGLYFGEIGVFMIELSKLLKHNLFFPIITDTLLTFFTPLFIWSKFEDKKRNLIIVISKMDTFEFSEESFKDASKIIKTICKNESIKMIPISIDMRGENDHNVFSKSKKMTWYSGPTLINVLENICKETSMVKIKKPLFISLDKQYDMTGIGAVLRGKILEGTLKNGSAIKITPVKYQNKEYVSILAKVRNIRFDKGNDTETAGTGAIVGMNLHDIRRIDGGRCKKEDFDIVKTSCIVVPSMHLSIGNILQFKISSEEIVQFHILETIMIPWFGRPISCKVVHKKEFSNYGLITLEIENLEASLPLDDDGKLLFNNFLLQKENVLFVPAVLEKLGVPSTLTFFIKDINDKKEDIESFLKFRYPRYEIDHDNIKFYPKKSVIGLILEIKRFNERFLKQEDVPLNIDINIEELKEKYELRLTK
jgi:translation elongation factor EF-1alpha